MNRPESGIYVRAQVAKGKWESIFIEDLTSEQFDLQFSDCDERIKLFHKFVTTDFMPYVLDLEIVQARANATLDKIDERLGVMGALNKDIGDVKRLRDVPEESDEAE